MAEFSIRASILSEKFAYPGASSSFLRVSVSSLIMASGSAGVKSDYLPRRLLTINPALLRSSSLFILFLVVIVIKFHTKAS